MSIDLTFVETRAEVEDFFRWLGERRAVLAFDTETGGLMPWRDPLRTVQFGDTAHGWCFPWDRYGGGVAAEVFTNYEGAFVAHNLIFDASFLKRQGRITDVPLWRCHDTRVMAHLLDPVRRTGLKPLADRYLGGGAGGQEDLQEVMAKNGWKITNCPIDLPQFWEYASLDTVLTAQLAELLWPRVQPFRAVYDVEMTTIQALYRMEEAGIAVDLGYSRRTRDDYRARVRFLEDMCRERWAIDNPHANPQVYQALQRDGVELVARTKTGQPSLTEDVLLGIEHPLAQIVLELRHKTKMASTYFDAFIELEDHGLLHPDINPLGARTGRMSITRPAMQTLIRGPEVRHAFVARPGHYLLLADYAGIEMRGMAHFAQEPTMIEAYLRGDDLHDFTAEKLYGPQFTKQQRDVAKNAGFSKIYGAGIAKFAMTARVSEGEARQFLDAYDRLFPLVRVFQQRVTDVIRQRDRDEGAGYVTTPLGRRHPVDPDTAYKAVNMLCQGWAADVLKQTIARMHQTELGPWLRLPVHDELMFEVPNTVDPAEAKRYITDVMTVHDFTVPLTVEVSGPYERWSDKYRTDPKWESWFTERGL